jgi:hypothetical protein
MTRACAYCGGPLDERRQFETARLHHTEWRYLDCGRDGVEQLHGQAPVRRRGQVFNARCGKTSPPCIGREVAHGD